MRKKATTSLTIQPRIRPIREPRARRRLYGGIVERRFAMPPPSGKRPPLPRPPLAAVQPRIYIHWHDLDQRRPPRLPRIFREERACAGAIGAFGPAQRPDPDVRQRRDGAVQE